MSAITEALAKDSAAIEPAQVILHLAQAEAALMVVECLMTALIEQKIISKDSLIDAVETVIETKRNMVLEHQHASVAAIAAGLMSALSNSLAAAGNVD